MHWYNTRMQVEMLERITLYRDADLLVVDKPAGLAVMADGWQKGSPCLQAMLREHLGRVWIVHRLDKVTSGVMVFALNPTVHRDLSLQFEDHQVGKEYHAILTGSPDWDQHTVDLPLRPDVGHDHHTAVDPEHGKPSLTLFKVLKRQGAACLVLAVPASGRTHQIRAHALALGFPLLGDVLYHAPASTLIDRPALHAWRLSFRHPGSRQAVTFQAPHPQDFAAALRLLGMQ